MKGQNNFESLDGFGIGEEGRGTESVKSYGAKSTEVVQNHVRPNPWLSFSVAVYFAMTEARECKGIYPKLPTVQTKGTYKNWSFCFETTP
jgi:hypothetical protein